MNRIIAIGMLVALMVGCISPRLSEADLIEAARNHILTNQKELTEPLSLGEYNPNCAKVEQTGKDYRVSLGYGSLSSDSLWLFSIVMSPDGRILKVEKSFQGYR
jgi:hypothetical protein